MRLFSLLFGFLAAALTLGASMVAGAVTAVLEPLLRWPSEARAHFHLMPPTPRSIRETRRLGLA